MSEILESLITYMRDDLGIDVEGRDHDESLFSTGVIDSFALVSLITFIERKFDIRIAATDVNLDNFDSLGRMRDYIKSEIA